MKGDKYVNTKLQKKEQTRQQLRTHVWTGWAGKALLCVHGSITVGHQFLHLCRCYRYNVPCWPSNYHGQSFHQNDVDN